MKTSFHYMNGYKYYIHVTNSCYKFSSSAIERQDGLANMSRGPNILRLSSSEEKFGWVFNSTVLQTSLVSNVLLPTLLSCSEFLWIATLKKIFYPKKKVCSNFKWATLRSFYTQIVILSFHWTFKDEKPSYHHLNIFFFLLHPHYGTWGLGVFKKKKLRLMHPQSKANGTLGNNQKIS